MTIIVKNLKININFTVTAASLAALAAAGHYLGWPM
jgi:hypothetical protein